MLSIELESVVINELSKLAMTIPIDQWGRWHWLEKEIQHNNNKYLIGAHIQRDCINKSIQICSQQCLLKQ